MVRSGKGSPLPPASLQLLVPPVRLMSAFVWKAVQQDSAVQYEKLLDFIDLVTEIVPELLSPSQKGQLVLGLRARFVLELCRGNGVANIKAIQGHLDKIHTCCLELSNNEHMESSDILKTSYSNFASLVQNILNVPLEKELFFQEVFPDHYGLAFNQRIQQLVSLLLSRLEQLLPIPDLQQVCSKSLQKRSSHVSAFASAYMQFFSMKTLDKNTQFILQYQEKNVSSNSQPAVRCLLLMVCKMLLCCDDVLLASTPQLCDFHNWITSQQNCLS
ncbi:uncharacterized protein LOC129358060 [Poeciliopsis prolifica]|uniref:uncharacterized protein LOC129358060 n=1 Tax=Poeciliopsis prolifica TaxID=188132 RepID=UPI00241449F7|nr:uncharacterized protein LOC129358060 [Poeciliopsis prolifica]